MRVRPVLLAAVVALGLAACTKQEQPGTRYIAVIPKGTTHEFWKSIHAGAEKAAKELGVTIDWKGPPKEDDREQQISVVEDFITRKVSGIVLAPLDAQALVAVCKEAAREKIPVVIIDSGIDWDGMLSFVATDNKAGGAKAGQRLGELLGGKGRVLMLRYQEGSASTMEREAGFLEVMKTKFPGIELVSTDQHGGATTGSAQQVAENLLTKFTELDGIFTPNESTTFGMLRALEDAGRAGKVKFVGFDASAKLLDGLKGGKIHGLVLQNPTRMGELGVRTLVAALDGKTVENRIDTGCVVATPENLASPEVQALVGPGGP